MLGSRCQSLSIAISARILFTDSQPLQGLRFAVKDVYHLRGLKKSFCNAVYLDMSSSAEKTATTVQNILNIGTRVVDMI